MYKQMRVKELCPYRLQCSVSEVVVTNLISGLCQILACFTLNGVLVVCGKISRIVLKTASHFLNLELCSTGANLSGWLHLKSIQSQ